MANFSATINTLGLSVFAIYFVACNNVNEHKSRGAIILGDSSTIVMEKDPQFLKDNVVDFQPQRMIQAEPVAANKDTQHVALTPAKAEEPKAAPIADVKGLKIPFKPFTVIIPNITTRSFKQQDVVHAKGVSYSLETGKLEGNTLQIKGATITKVVQRYQTVVIIKDKEAGNILLQSLGTYSSEWHTIKGSGGNYTIAGINKSQLDFNDVSTNAIHNAVSKAARSNRLSRKEEQQMLKTIKNIRSPKQSPLSIVLKNVVWKISAKDAVGKPVEKEIRIDLPAAED
jgi:hypothetical protein